MDRGGMVSVIVTVYNLESYVEKCLLSIQNQTYKNIEIIIIDDGSIDNSVKICEEVASLDARIKLIKQENQGVVKARNRGIELAAGKYIMFVDGDDWIDNNMVEELVVNMQGMDIVTAGMYKEIEKGKVIKERDKLKKGVSGIDYILKNMMYIVEEELFRPIIPTLSGKLFKTDIIREVYLTIDPTITYAEDGLLLYKYLLKCKFVNILDKYFYHYVYRSNSAVHQGKDDKLISANKIYISLKKDIKDHYLNKELTLQLEKWIKYLVLRAINFGMDFNDSPIPSYIVNTKGLDNKKIVLYGAGVLGKEAYVQLSKFGYDIVLWVDKNWETYKEKGYEVVSPDKISTKDYDVIFIAVTLEKVAKDIKNGLSNIKIPEEKILWNRHIRIY